MARKIAKPNGRFVLLSISFSRWSKVKKSWVVNRALEKMFVRWEDDIDVVVKKWIKSCNTLLYHNNKLKLSDKELMFYYEVIKDNILLY